MTSRLWRYVLGAAGIFSSVTASAQIDPVRREMFQLGYNQPFISEFPVSLLAENFWKLGTNFRASE